MDRRDKSPANSATRRVSTCHGCQNQCGIESLGLDIEGATIKIHVIYGNSGVERASFALIATLGGNSVSIKHLDLDCGHPSNFTLQRKGINPKLHQTYMYPDSDGEEARKNLGFWPKDLRKLWEYFKREVNLKSSGERRLYQYLKVPVVCNSL